MAREAFSASILESNLESLKNKSTEVADQFKSLTGAAEKFGVSFSQSVRSATNNLQGLQSALSRLESGLRKVSTTGSVVGAANISSALGQLTGQGGGGGGGGRGGWSGGQGRFPTMGGGGGLASLLTGKSTPGPAEKAVKFTAGMMMAAMKQQRDARLQWEQSGYLSRFIGGPKESKAFRNLKQIGLGPEQGRGIYDMMARTFGGTDEELAGYRPGGFEERPGRVKSGERAGKRNRKWRMGKTTSDTLLNFKRLATGMGLGEGELAGLGGAIKAGGGGLGALAGTRDQMYQIYGQSKARMENLHIPGKRGRQAALDRSNTIMTRNLTELYQQQAAISNIGPQTLRKAPGFLGALGDETRGGFDPAVAGMLLKQLRGGTLAPGGGQAGEVFALQSAGFGNPYLKQEQAMAARLGVTDANLQRRDYISAKKFREENPIEMILNQMIGVATKFAGQGLGVQGFGLSQLTGIKQSRAEQLMEMVSSGQFTGDALRKRVEKISGQADPKSKVGGDEKQFAGRAGVSFMKQLALMDDALLTSTGAVLKFTKTLNKVQISMHKFAGDFTDQIEKILTKLNKKTDETVQNPGKKKVANPKKKSK